MWTYRQAKIWGELVPGEWLVEERGPSVLGYTRLYRAYSEAEAVWLVERLNETERKESEAA